MLKVNAATVAERWARQGAPLVQAATEILVAQGATAVTPAAAHGSSSST